MPTGIMCRRCYNEATVRVTVDAGTGDYLREQNLCAICALTMIQPDRIIKTVKLYDYPDRVYTTTRL